MFCRLLALTTFIITSVHAQEIRHVPLTLSKGGTPENPTVFDGKGIIIDLGIDVTTHDWQKNNDVWTSNGPFAKHPAVTDPQRGVLFIEEVPMRIVRDREAEKKGGVAGQVIFAAQAALKPGEVGFTAEGAIYFRWPVGKKPGTARIFLPPANLASCVSIQCSHIIVRNITAIHAANDGFNIHGARVGVRLEHVKAFSNGDEGISAHETVQMDVVNAEIAWNGSSAGGVADVNDSVTTYTNCEVHHNLGAAFSFAGKSHRVTNCVIHHQAKDFEMREDAQLIQSGVEWRRE